MFRPTQVPTLCNADLKYGAFTLCGPAFLPVPLSLSHPLVGPITPAHASRRRRFGLFPVRSPLLGESFLLSFPAGTKMFQFPAFASVLRTDAGIAACGFPHSDICGSRCICHSPQLFAACHVLLRLQEPRHPPCALTVPLFLNSPACARLFAFRFARETFCVSTLVYLAGIPLRHTWLPALSLSSFFLVR